jgi:hypothetical protein
MRIGVRLQHWPKNGPHTVACRPTCALIRIEAVQTVLDHRLDSGQKHPRHTQRSGELRRFGCGGTATILLYDQCVIASPFPVGRSIHMPCQPRLFAPHSLNSGCFAHHPITALQLKLPSPFACSFAYLFGVESPSQFTPSVCPTD